VGRVWELAKRIYPLNRSISSEDNLKTLEIIREYIGKLDIKYWDIGESFSSWEIPKGWKCKNAWIIDENNKKYCDFKKRNLRVTSFSIPINRVVKWSELKDHLHYSKKLEAHQYPYTTSYYNADWGFNVTYEEYKKLENQKCQVFIDSEFQDDCPMHYGEFIYEGKTKKEILLTTYICHPSMGNNETSGMCVASELARKLIEKKQIYEYSIRIIFIPETIGSIFYLRDNLHDLKKNAVLGFVLTCLGDNSKSFSIPLTYKKKGILEKCLNSLELSGYIFKKYPAEDRGSDERQFSWPTVGLDFTSISKSKYHEYPQYHSSSDDLTFISEDSLNESCELIENIIKSTSNNKKIKTITIGEPFLMSLDLGAKIGGLLHNKHKKDIGTDLINVLWYSNGNNDTFDISLLLKLEFFYILELQDLCLNKGLAILSNDI
tara:strand:- start:216 stop:1514 length:1299 start_codon:yes stop_codon:yes gene_type:complete